MTFGDDLNALVLFAFVACAMTGCTHQSQANSKLQFVGCVGHTGCAACLVALRCAICAGHSLLASNLHMGLILMFARRNHEVA
jgi:hypothetical protein